jgi:hypothetical protein
MKQLVNGDKIDELRTEFLKVVDGEPMTEVLAAMAATAVDILSSVPDSHEEALVMFNAMFMTITENMAKRVNENECNWQSTKQ